MFALSSWKGGAAERKHIRRHTHEQPRTPRVTCRCYQCPCLTFLADTRIRARNFCRTAQGRPEHTFTRRLPRLYAPQTTPIAQINTPAGTTKTSSLRPQYSPRARKKRNKGCPLAHTWAHFPVSAISLPHANVGSCQLYPISWRTSRRRVRWLKLLPLGVSQ